MVGCLKLITPTPTFNSLLHHYNTIYIFQKKKKGNSFSSFSHPKVSNSKGFKLDSLVVDPPKLSNSVEVGVDTTLPVLWLAKEIPLKIFPSFLHYYSFFNLLISPLSTVKAVILPSLFFEFSPPFFFFLIYW